MPKTPKIKPLACKTPGCEGIVNLRNHADGAWWTCPKCGAIERPKPENAPFLLTTEQIRETIERAGEGDSFKSKMLDVAVRGCECGVATLYNYLRDGPKRGPVHKLLCLLAHEHGVVPRPSDTTGVMM